MEAVFESRIEDHYDELAYHYSCSGNSQKAALYLRRAGDQAAHRSFDRLEDYLRDLQMRDLQLKDQKQGRKKVTPPSSPRKAA
jgi:hypothetical protein